jgi:hypothetical protein
MTIIRRHVYEINAVIHCRMDGADALFLTNGMEYTT